MNTEPLGEAQAANSPPHGPPEAPPGNVADSRSVDSSPESATPQNQGPMPPDSWSTGNNAASEEQQDVDPASFKTATSEVTATSESAATTGNRDKKEAVSGDKQEEAAISGLPKEPGAMQAPTGPPSPGWAPLLEDRGVLWNSGFQGEDRMAQSASGPEPLGLAATAPEAQAHFFYDTDTQSELAEGQQAFIIVMGSEFFPADECLQGMEVALVDSSRDLQFESFPPSPPGGHTPPSPGLQRRPLDSTLYRAAEDNGFLHSMTSLLDGGEGSASSLADILVWSESSMGMAMALGFLTSGHSSPTDLLHSPGPSLRPISSVLGQAGSVFSARLTAGPGSALRAVNHVLETVERRATESLRSAMRFLSNHLALRRAPPDPNNN
ncbi:testis-expressed protein 44 isoform X1 [Ochotona princeps]|uniref:testis-expressed protein 44 isoform X1 n=1 Tax=Ochotona princeps TaxID=9978 RepID=UPI002714976D|nr:testis-expressed protein 44 isoform X1 [Ochotona princeps]